MIQFRGIEFRGVDNRLMALKLVQLGLSGVAMFGPDREVLQPSEVLRKQAVLVERGSFRPPTHVNLDMLATAKEKFAQDPAVEGKPILQLTEITMRNLLAERTDVDRRDFLARAELLAACGETVLITDYFDYYRLAAYIGQRTKERIGIVMGVPSLIDLFDERNHAQLPGGILESFGRLFKNGLKLYVYPLQPDARTTSSGRSTASRSSPSSSRCTTTWPAGAASSTWTTTGPSTCTSSAGTCCGGSPRTTTPGRKWSQGEVAELIKRRGFFGYVKPDARE